MQAVLAYLHVQRAQAAQLGTPTSLCDFAPLAAEMAEVREAADHAQLRLTQISHERNAEKGAGRSTTH
eukprot:1184240-Pyramimonas_sp.AAC.1